MLLIRRGYTMLKEVKLIYEISKIIFHAKLQRSKFFSWRICMFFLASLHGKLPQSQTAFFFRLNKKGFNFLIKTRLNNKPENLFLPYINFFRLKS